MINPLKAPGVVYDLVSKRLKNTFGMAKTDVTGVNEALKVCATSFSKVSSHCVMLSTSAHLWQLHWGPFGPRAACSEFSIGLF